MALRYLKTALTLMYFHSPDGFCYEGRTEVTVKRVHITDESSSAIVLALLCALLGLEMKGGRGKLITFSAALTMLCCVLRSETLQFLYQTVMQLESRLALFSVCRKCRC